VPFAFEGRWLFNCEKFYAAPRKGNQSCLGGKCLRCTSLLENNAEKEYARKKGEVQKGKARLKMQRPGLALGQREGAGPR